MTITEEENKSDQGALRCEFCRQKITKFNDPYHHQTVVTKTTPSPCSKFQEEEGGTHEEGMHRN